jgi:hypothetical protein
LVGHDLSMRILYQFHGWLIFARVIALFMFVWPYIRSHILCTQPVICLLSHFIHIWYLRWLWSEHAQILPISRMVDFCESYSSFHVCLTICLFAHLVYATSHLSFVTFYYVPQTKFGRHIVFAPFLITVFFLLLFFFLSFFLPSKVCPTHFSEMPWSSFMKPCRNIVCHVKLCL